MPLNELTPAEKLNGLPSLVLPNKNMFGTLSPVIFSTVPPTTLSVSDAQEMDVDAQAIAKKTNNIPSD